MNEPMLKKAMDTLEFLSQDAATRMEYDARMKYLRDEASRMNGAKAEGRAEGRAEGIAEGIAKGEQKRAEAIVLELLALGVETSVILKASGLTEQQILRLKAQMGKH